MNTYLKNWDWKRVLQLIIGIYFIWNYVEDGMLFSALFGGLLSFQAILNVGCFSTKGCTVQTNKTTKNDNVTFEEVNN